MRGTVEVSDVGTVPIVHSDSARIQVESPATAAQLVDSYGRARPTAGASTVEVNPEGDVMLVGAVRDAEMYSEAVRRAREVARVRQVRQDIKVMELGPSAVKRPRPGAFLAADTRGIDRPGRLRPGRGVVVASGGRPDPRLCGERGSNSVTVIDAESLKILATIDARNHATHDLALSRDGRFCSPPTSPRAGCP